jgi:ribonuclease Z
MRLTFGDLSLEGASRGGDRTWFRVHPPGAAFDVGRGAVELAGAADIFLTHGHLDHCLGLPFALSYRARHGAGRTRIACPEAIVHDLEDWLAATARLERATYDFELLPMAPRDRVAVAPDLEVEAFAAHHVVPALGYRLVRTRRHLAAAYRGAPAAELAALRREGVVIEDAIEEDWLAYCGDTAASVLDAEPRLLTSRILLIECTFLLADHRERAARYGHVHVEDLAERVDRIACEHVVLYHLSRRHDAEELAAVVAERLAPIADRVTWVVT